VCSPTLYIVTALQATPQAIWRQHVRNLDQYNITQAVLARLANTPDPRLKQIMTSLVQHLHAFAREVKLTEAEWMKGIEFLTATGHKCDQQRQEFILLSDTLGLSMLTVAMNNDKPAGCTEATVFGPFHVEGAPHYEHGDDVANGASGEPCLVRGSVRGIQGEPIANAVIDVWQADAEGSYDVQRTDLEHAQARGVLRSGADGRFHFQSVVAESYPIPDDGPVGDMLRATARHPWRPAHLHFMIQAPGYETLVTHVFRDGDAYLDSDAVFGVRQSLVADWVKQPDGTTTLDFDFVLNPVKKST
jgi:hydroxyquinol 1,2-dioxygenase